MNKDYDYLQKCLLELSTTIDMLLSGDNPISLDQMEEWTRTHYQKIRLKIDHSDSIILKGFDKKEPKEDALFIFDSGFEVICYSGSQNFFSGTASDSVKNFNLLELIELQDRPKLQALFDLAVQTGESVRDTFRIKSNIEILGTCALEIDMMSSNPSNDRYVARVMFSEMLTSQILEYQALILDNLPGMDIYLFDTEYKYLYASGREKERHELSNVHFIGNTMFNVLDSKTVRLIYPYVTKALQGVKNEGEIRYETDIYFLKAVPVKDFNNRNIGAILFSQNITNNKKQEAQLKRGIEEAQNADRLKSIFIANISHEIRTPLNSIIGFTKQLQKTSLTADQIKFTELISKSSEHLLYLVTEIVYLFKLGMGKVYLEKIPFSLKDLLLELDDTFNKEAIAKNLILTVNCDGAIPDILIGDSFRIRQILINLLTNAIKFTDSGTVSLQCSVMKASNKNTLLLFKVSDTGIGISRVDQKIIFNVFEQGNKLNSGSKRGAGLGLGICKSLTELLGGNISVKSKLHEGSTFSVILPLDKPGPAISLPPAEVTYNTEINNTLLAGRKVLVADDDEYNLILAEHIMESWKTDYLLVNDGQKAIESLAKQRFDIALIDIHMPVKNGLDVIAWLRADKKGINSKIPVICITANVLKSDLNLYLKEGFDDFMIKPYSENELYNKLCNVLITTTESTMKLPDKPSVTDNLVRDSFDVQDLLATARGNRSFFEKMVTSFISNAINLKDMFLDEISVDNITNIGEKTHKSIPSFKYFGLSSLAGELEVIEEKTLRNIDINGAREAISFTLPHIEDAIEQAKASLRQL